MNNETVEEILRCAGYSDGKKNNIQENISYDWFFSGEMNLTVQVAKEMKKRLKVREKLLAQIT